jgi:flagellar biosynthesis protein FlhG
MVDNSLAEDYRRLDVGPEASLLEVERAYFHRRALYTQGSLATYGLMEPSEQQQHLEEIEAAFARITAALRLPVPPPVSSGEGASNPMAPDECANPASQLKQARLRAKLTLKELAHTLKIGHLHLQNIEDERFDALPATVYLRGFLLSFAKELNIPHPEDLASRFLARRAAAGPGGE